MARCETPSGTTLRIGEVAKRAGVTVPTLRYYERRGLIAAEARSSGNYRQFGDDVITRVMFIKRAQSLGFDLEEVRVLLDLRDTVPPSHADVRSVTERKLGKIEEELARLTSVRDVLRGLLTVCRDAESTATCPILDALDDSEDRSKTTRTGNES